MAQVQVQVQVQVQSSGNLNAQSFLETGISQNI
jgi:hypothetical protein